MHIVFEQGAGGHVPSLGPTGAGPRLTLATPIRCARLRGGVDEFAYADVTPDGPDAWVATRSWESDGLRITVEDRYEAGDDVVRLVRRLRASGAADAIRVELSAELAEPGAVRYCAPAMVYSPVQHAEPGTQLFNDARLAYPLVLVWAASSATGVTLLRTSLPGYDEAPERVAGDSDYPQRTDIGAVGFAAGGERPALLATWPYREGDRSALLDAEGTPAAAFHPVGPEGLDVTVAYALTWRAAPTFADAVAGAYAYAAQVNPPRPADLPFTLEQAAGLRLASLRHTYTEWAPGAAGFRMNFDPDRGYDAEAKAFGASFTEHGMTGSHAILEYGFTGRQLNAAAMLAEHFGGEWDERADKVADFFVERLATPSGFLHTLYSIDKGRPLFSCGDPDGPVMHYLGAAEQPGTYLRMMTEAAGDLLLHHRRGRSRPAWLATCVRFADFLLAAQEPDGSWYRAYNPDGEPLDGGWLGAAGGEGKASTAVPVPYLLALAAALPPGERDRLVTAARAAGEYVLREQVARDDYRGGTLDNPNVVDKEAAELAMAALLALHDATGDPKWLTGAERAAKIAVTWHLLWDVPPRAGTRVAAAGVRSTGWGGINSTWGAGVTDIYSLFFLDAFVTIGRRTGEPLYETVADLAAYGCQQILSHDGDRFGFADTGMQPEGISFCDQGADAGLIAKGDTWGGLGWPYTAGTYGLHRYLTAKGNAHVVHP
ncbi:AGE family epimerase/isomerase [Symbioplanes lichenis]|uniref:AGE family epimerase/isomerase n=1 Tax=Symbioplanes lichenis TaxID=1629072 RepID=UPI002739418B|nr:AGE family epimerase/isomerase [Actinoplanes lichenis]